MSVYEKLNGGEKAALVQSWQRYTRALINVQSFPLNLRGQSGYDFDGNLTRLWRASQAHAELAKRREAYLYLIQSTWFRATWTPQGATPNPALPKTWFRNDELDQLLWESHPVNLFQSIEEEALGAEETA